MYAGALLLVASCIPGGAELDLPLGSWVKLTPLEDTPVSPRLGYEGACVWDSIQHRFIRYGGHNQGGGGEQHSEVWSFDPVTARWALHEPDISPPGVCCAQQNVFDPVHALYVRFPAFSGSHGWQWWREIYLNNTSVWTYHLAENRWRNRWPLPAPSPRGLRCASWDTHHQVIVLFGGETSREGTLVYDPHANAWTRMRPGEEPAFRSGGNMAYDEERKLHILFGSQFSDDPHTWAYDLRANTWRDLKPKDLPPTHENDAVLAYDSAARKIVSIVKITEGEGESSRHRLETWIYDTGENRWSRLDPDREPDPSGNRARVLAYAPELNATLLENRTHPPHGPPEQQIWALRLAAGATERHRGDLLPLDFRVVTAPGAAGLSWTTRKIEAAPRWRVYRGEGNAPWQVHFKEVGGATATAQGFRYEDRDLQSSVVYHYKVQAITAEGSLGPESRVARAQPEIVEDVVVSAVSEGRVDVSWPTPAARDVTGYIVERARVGVLTEDQLVRLKRSTPPLDAPSVGAVETVGPFARVTDSPIAAGPFVDRTVDLSRPGEITGERSYDRKLHPEQVDRSKRPYRFAVFAYRVRAVNALGVPSGPSAAVLTIPSAPRQLFSNEEEGRTCRLRWAANPEKGITGYRVYRMDSRWDGRPIPRLTVKPVASTSFSDREAGDRTRRYYVVAVDALGQEGFPSSPVWFDREWKKYYEPFAGAWHQ